MRHELRVPLAWHWIERVRQTAAEAVAGYPAELVEAAVMVASELAENLVKYGHALDGDESGTLAIEWTGRTVTIASTNGATPEESAKVIALVRAIREADDVGALYVARLTEMAATPADSASELGLLRIAFEGGFSLDVVYEEPRLRLAATRKVDA